MELGNMPIQVQSIRNEMCRCPENPERKGHCEESSSIHRFWSPSPDLRSLDLSGSPLLKEALLHHWDATRL